MIPIRYNLRSLAVRKATTFATAFGIALVVFVLAAALMLSEGIARTLGASGRSDVAIVLRKGSENELSSGIDDPQVSLVAAMPGVASDASGPLVTGEVVVVTALEKLGAQGLSNVQLRGVPANGFAFRPAARVVEGRAPKPGTDEALVGVRIRGRFRGTDLGQSFDLRKGRPITIVGVFADDGSSHESEIWCDLDTLRTTFGREGTVSAIRVRLTGSSAFDGFQATLEADKRLGLAASRESSYYEKQSSGTSTFITALGGAVAVFFALGAMIGATITMYAAVANRTREIGTLRALGFSRASILVSFVVESLALALGGGLLGVAGALAMRGVRFSMMNFASWSEVVFTFEPTAGIVTTALAFAGGMGLLGGILPAVRAAGISPTAAMRS
jgi:putative ABC transport system permease protein